MGSALHAQLESAEGSGRFTRVGSALHAHLEAPDESGRVLISYRYILAFSVPFRAARALRPTGAYGLLSRLFYCPSHGYAFPSTRRRRTRGLGRVTTQHIQQTNEGNVHKSVLACHLRGGVVPPSRRKVLFAGLFAHCISGCTATGINSNWDSSSLGLLSRPIMFPA